MGVSLDNGPAVTDALDVIVKMDDVSRRTAKPAPVPSQTRVSAKGTISLIELLLSPLKAVVSKSTTDILNVPGSNPWVNANRMNNENRINFLTEPPALS